MVKQIRENVIVKILHFRQEKQTRSHKMSPKILKMIPSSEENFSWSIIKHKMSVKLPNNYSDKCRQTAADTAGCMANCSCNCTYFTRASENLARLTAALFHSLHLLFLLLLSSASYANSVLLSLTHTAVIAGVFHSQQKTWTALVLTNL